MANNNRNFEKQTSGSTPDASPERDRLLHEHQEKFPEGDPSVRRISPEKGTIGVGDTRNKKPADRKPA